MPSRSLNTPGVVNLVEHFRRMRQRRATEDEEVQLTPEERKEVEQHVWRAPASLAKPPGPDRVLPQMPSPNLRIECVPSEPRATLTERVESCEREQASQGRLLASTFCHAGSIFLIFKRRASGGDFSRSI